MTMREQRRTPRIAERVVMAITDAGTELTTESHNLSTAGVYCTLDRFLAPMSKVQLHFTLTNGPRASKVRCTGVVVRVEPVIANASRGRFNVAIFFTELSNRDRAAITRFVRQRLSAASASG
jgi:hypothetical protein